MGRKKYDFEDEKTEEIIKEKIIIKKTIQLKMNKSFNLKEGQELPEEIDKKFHSSLKTMEII